MADDVIGRVRQVRDLIVHFELGPADLRALDAVLAVAEAARAFIAADVALGDRPQDATLIIARTTTLNKLHAAVAAMGEG